MGRIQPNGLIGSSGGDGIAVVSQFTVPHRVSFMLFHRMHLVIGDEIGSISFYDHEGNLLESQEMDGGVQSCQPMG